MSTHHKGTLFDMTRERPEERWACRTMSAALEAVVVIHDDQSRESMHDLEISYPNGRKAVGEVVSATDGESVALWKLVNPPGRRWIVPELRGGWMLVLDCEARAKRVKEHVPPILGQLEGAGVTAVETAHRSSTGSPSHRLATLGVLSAHQSGTDFPGSIYVTLERPSQLSGGMVDNSGAPMSTWIGEFLSMPAQADVRSKLAVTGAGERHAFIVVPGFSTAPFGVQDLLMRGGSLPVEPPRLPDEVTHAWAFSTWDVPQGIRWSPHVGWQWFDTLMGDAT